MTILAELFSRFLRRSVPAEALGSRRFSRQRFTQGFGGGPRTGRPGRLNEFPFGFL